jgi:hypothetical protein
MIFRNRFDTLIVSEYCSNILISVNIPKYSKRNLSDMKFQAQKNASHINADWLKKLNYLRETK